MFYQKSEKEKRVKNGIVEVENNAKARSIQSEKKAEKF